MGICQMLLLQLHFDIYNVLNEKQLIFLHDLIGPPTQQSLMAGVTEVNYKSL